MRQSKYTYKYLQFKYITAKVWFIEFYILLDLHITKDFIYRAPI